MIILDKDKEFAVQECRHLFMDLRSALSDSGDCFSVRLFQLIMKADLRNRHKIKLGFPKHVEAYLLWQEFGEDILYENPNN